jgi:hypothetical protein
LLDHPGLLYQRERVIRVDALRPLGITFVGQAEVTVKDGKIASSSYTLDEATLAKLQAIPTATPAK